jgi:hypothetical protein
MEKFRSGFFLTCFKVFKKKKWEKKVLCMMGAVMVARVNFVFITIFCPLLLSNWHCERIHLFWTCRPFVSFVSWQKLIEKMSNQTKVEKKRTFANCWPYSYYRWTGFSLFCIHSRGFFLHSNNKRQLNATRTISPFVISGSNRVVIIEIHHTHLLCHLSPFLLINQLFYFFKWSD